MMVEVRRHGVRPLGVTSRPLEGEEDYEALRRFVVEIQPRVGTRVYATVSDLDWWRWTARTSRQYDRLESG